MKRWTYMTAVVLVGVAVAATASARGVAAFIGRPAVASVNCMNLDRNTGVVRNDCGIQIDYMIPLDTDSNGLKSIDLALQVPSTAGTRCRAVAIPRSGTSASATAFVSPTVVNTPTNIVMTKATSPQAPVVVSKGLLYVDCQVGAGASLIQADWNN
jgi:hypothetical protein